ncbi:unnamed protein product, partial [Ectocarpus sp. 8 AP-2014]
KCRGHRGGGGRRRYGGGGGGGSEVRGVAGRLPRLVALLAVALAWWSPSSMLVEAECADGLEGILSSNEEACCIVACGMCGGSGCSDVEDTNGGSDCCVDDILDSDVTCGVDDGVAPCIVDPDIITTPSAAEAATPAPTAVEGATPAPAAPAAGTATPSMTTTAPGPTAVEGATPAPAVPAAGTATPSMTTTAPGPTAPTAPTAPAAPAAGTATPSMTTTAPGPTAPATTTTIAPSSTSPTVSLTTTAQPAPAAVVVAAPSAQPSVATPTAAVATASPVAGSFTPVAPVAGASSNCENGYAGWQSNEACCSEFCGQCGGSGCGELGSATCCFDNIINAGLVCGVDVLEAPCIIINFTPAPLAEGETAAPLPAPTSPAPATAAPATAAPFTVSPDTAAPAAPAPAAPAAPAAETEAPSTPAPVATESPVSRGGVGVPTPSPGGSEAPQESVAPSVAPPVGGGVGTTPAPSAPECDDRIEGFRHGVACCSVSCGQCGGAGCENLEGGASECCSHDVLATNILCSDTGVAPCVLGPVSEVDGAADADTTTSSGGGANRIAGGGRGGRVLLVLPWAVSALLNAAGFRLYNY